MAEYLNVFSVLKEPSMLMKDYIFYLFIAALSLLFYNMGKTCF